MALLCRVAALIPVDTQKIGVFLTVFFHDTLCRVLTAEVHPHAVVILFEDTSRGICCSPIPLFLFLVFVWFLGRYPTNLCTAIRFYEIRNKSFDTMSEVFIRNPGI